MSKPTFTCGRRTDDELKAYLKMKYADEIWAIRHGVMNENGNKTLYFRDEGDCDVGE